MVDQRDRQLIELIRSMVARPEYLLPLAAADKQYRDHYYRLNAAALLEDLFFDALGNHVRQTHPELQMERAIGGGLEWDYSLAGWCVSHKVLSKVGKVAVHWDATVQATMWSANHSIVIVLSQSDPGRWTMLNNSNPFRVRAAGPRDALVSGRHALLVNWTSDDSGSTATVIDSFAITNGVDRLDQLVDFEVIWAHVAKSVRSGGSAAQLDVLLTESVAATAGPGDVLTGDDARLPAGVYLLPADSLQDVPVTSNNRSAKLIGRDNVASAMGRARAAHLFARLPLWFRCYSGSRPPDLYAAQRAEYDALFSARALHNE